MAGFAAGGTTGGVTFADDPRTVFVSARRVADALKLPLDYDPRSDLAFLGSIPLDYRCAVGNDRYVRLSTLTKLGARIQPRSGRRLAITLKSKELLVQTGAKRAIVDKSKQELRAYQGGELVLVTHVSTGKYLGSTPLGTFRVGSTKDAYHSSSKYGDAPMPWAVHVTRNVFVHGSESVPNTPASHGCVRVPMDAAEWFYKWVEPGTVVTIRG